MDQGFPAGDGMPQMDRCTAQGHLTTPHPCLCVLFVIGHEESFPEGIFAPLRDSQILLGITVILYSASLCCFKGIFGNYLS